MGPEVDWPRMEADGPGCVVEVPRLGVCFAPKAAALGAALSLCVVG